MIKKLYKITLALLLFALPASANNIQITNVSLAGINTTDDFIMVKFDISWENSWRISTNPPYNWDAAWIFVKYRVNGGEWLHATLSTSDIDHNAPAGFTVDAASDGMGVFMYRAADGTGTNTWANAQLCWNYGTNGVADNATSVEVKVLGIEMVYVPQGVFYAGDNAWSSYSFRQGSADYDPWYIGSEDAISVTGDTGSGTGTGRTNAEYYYFSSPYTGEDATGATFAIPAAFSKGYNAFYCMKYEITLGQYTDFLNMLTRAQQQAHITSTISADVITNIYVMSGSTTIVCRNSIVCPASGNGTIKPVVFSCTTPEIACNFLNWADGTAYVDWAGLRPMTELEFEKACRGTFNAVSGEYAWGINIIAWSQYNLSNAGTMVEGIASNYSTTLGNAAYYNTIYTNIRGPIRAGIFARSNSWRVTSGAGYYGACELSGNLSERVVSVGNSIGRAFTGSNGNGLLSVVGNADVEYWPDITATGSGFRGGSWIDDQYYLNSSSRILAAYIFSYRDSFIGFRGVRCP